MRERKSTFNVLESVEKHIEGLKPFSPKQAIVCIGEYPIKVLLKEPFSSKTTKALPILIGKSSDDIEKWIPSNVEDYVIFGFEDANIDTHFWFNITPYLSKDESLMEGLKKKPLEKLHGAIVASSVWDGVGSALLPTMISKFKALNLNSIGIAMLPSKVQPSDAHFNALAAVGVCASAESATILLLDRDNTESYEGVNRKGSLIKGNEVANYLLNILFAKETLAQEISELSKSFSTKIYSLLLVTGASYKIYGSLENMLNTAVLKPLLTFDMSSAGLLYVLLRMPVSLKDKLPRGKIELEIASWFKGKAALKTIYITEPIYVEDFSDRIDIVMFVGGFDTAKMFADIEKNIKPIKTHAVDKGYLKEEEWKEIVKNLELKEH